MAGAHRSPPSHYLPSFRFQTARRAPWCWPFTVSAWPRNSPLLDLISWSAGNWVLLRKSSTPDNGLLQMMVTPSPDVSQPTGLTAWGQKNPDPVTINRPPPQKKKPHSHPRLLPVPAPCLESFDLWLSFNTIAMVPGRSGQFSLPSGEHDEIRGVN